MKKCLFTFSVCCFLLLFFSSQAGATAPATGVCGENAAWSYENGTLTISGSGTMEDYDTLANWGSTAPWFDAFYRDIRRIVIEDGITSIGNGAFANCYYLQNVSIPYSVTSIGEYAFYGIYDLTSIAIPAATNLIGRDAFNMCRALERIDVAEANPTYASDENGVLYSRDKTVLLRYPASSRATTYAVFDTTLKIAKNAFYNATLVKNIKLPQGLTSIGASAFEHCGALVALNLPASISDIGDSSFSSCSSLEAFVVDEGNLFFSSCETGVLYNKDKTVLYQYPAGRTDKTFSAPQGVTALGSGAFAGSNLEQVILPNGLKTIGSYAFSYCLDLRNIAFPDTLTFIGHDAFHNDFSLSAVILPDTIETLEYRAFHTGDSLAIFFEGAAPTICADNAFEDDAILYYQDGQAGWDAPVWSNFHTIPVSSDEKASLSVNYTLWGERHTIYVDVAPYRIFIPDATAVQLFCAVYDSNGRMLEISSLPLDIIGGTVSSGTFEFIDSLSQFSGFQVFCLMGDGSLTPCGASQTVAITP